MFACVCFNFFFLPVCVPKLLFVLDALFCSRGGRFGQGHAASGGSMGKRSCGLQRVWGGRVCFGEEKWQSKYHC